MTLKAKLRLAALLMLIIAIIFLSVALGHPELGTVFYIGSLKIGATVWRIFYAVYSALMLVLFIASFFV